MITNKEIASMMKQAATLLELHGENEFKTRGYSSVAFKLERMPEPIAALSAEAFDGLEGFSKTMVTHLKAIVFDSTFPLLQSLLASTPEGVVQMLALKGLGPKKVKILWQEMEITSIAELSYACNENRLLNYKGFGEKTQSSILAAIEQLKMNKGKLLLSAAIPLATKFQEIISRLSGVNKVEIAGDIRRHAPVVEEIVFVILVDNIKDITDLIAKGLRDGENLSVNHHAVSWINEEEVKFKCIVATDDNFESELFHATGHSEWVDWFLNNDKSIKIKDELTLFKVKEKDYVLPIHREWVLKDCVMPPAKALISFSDLKGTLHNHSTYSDGAHSLREMVAACKLLGLTYFGICDHSKTASYANGLSEERVLAQHKEIEKLNSLDPSFKIFKGIESDILVDGALDYDTDLLKQFDFVVASIHSGFNMDVEKATTRLIKAIENPFTRILGHPTGRLLLGRTGYPIDFKKVIDACAANAVAIELNANPRRLDIDWMHIPYALSKGIRISINPDAHHKDKLSDMQYGVWAAAKGGLQPHQCLNACTTDELAAWFSNPTNFS